MAIKKLDEAPSDSDQDKSAKQHRQSPRTPWAPAGCIGRYELWITLPRMHWRDDVVGFNGGVGHFRLLTAGYGTNGKGERSGGASAPRMRRAENINLRAPAAGRNGDPTRPAGKGRKAATVFKCDRHALNQGMSATQPPGGKGLGSQAGIQPDIAGGP
jgi:hypothetical protein